MLSNSNIPLIDIAQVVERERGELGNFWVSLVDLLQDFLRRLQHLEGILRLVLAEQLQGGLVE